RWSAQVPSAADTAWWSRERPPMGCITLGRADFIRVPWPADSTMTAGGRVCDIVESFAWRLGPAPPIGLEPILHGSKGRRAAITPGRNSVHQFRGPRSRDTIMPLRLILWKFYARSF